MTQNQPLLNGTSEWSIHFQVQYSDKQNQFDVGRCCTVVGGFSYREESNIPKLSQLVVSTQLKNIGQIGSSSPARGEM